jgi:hypothetical protein
MAEEIKNKYHTGKIYSIRSFLTDKYYIGSTTQPLSKRLSKHKGNYTLWLKDKTRPRSYVSSFEILKLNDAYIELIENIKCENKEELHKREGELIREHKNNIVNIKIPNRYKKEQNQENYKKNRDERLEKQKQYSIDNKEKIKEKNQSKITCECMAIIRIYEKSRHLKTKKHLKFINNNI